MQDSILIMTMIARRCAFEDESQDLESLEACSQTAAISTLGMH